MDKLGGTVRGIYASAHSWLSPNNIYHNFHEQAGPVELPLFAIVELGKHATAPDIDGNGFFTPGLDVNHYVEKAKLWGVRDAIGATDAIWRSYEGSMAIPRRREEWVTIGGFREEFSTFPAEVRQDQQCLCELLPFDSLLVRGNRPRHSQTFHEALTTEAGRKLTSHRDAKNKAAIFKPWVFPEVFSRIGSEFEGRAGSPTLYAAVVMDMEMFRRPVPIPGRLAFEFLGQVRPVQERRFFSAGVRYERLLSNLVGLHFGIHVGIESFKVKDAGGQTIRTENRKDPDLWFSAGPMFEVPLRFTNFNFQLGMAFKNESVVRLEYRVAFGVPGIRKRFGIGRKHPNPYN